MRTSQIALLAGAGVLVTGMLVVAILGRAGLSAVSAGEPGGIDSRDLGASTSRSLDLANFDSVVVHGAWTVEIVQGENWQVDLDYPEGLDSALEVTVSGGQLVLVADEGASRRRWGWFGGHDNDLTARLVMPELVGVEVMGTSHLEFSGFEGDELAFDLSGAINLEGRNGRYSRLELAVSGAGHVDLQDVPVRDADVRLSGASMVELRMDGGVLSGDLSGVGAIHYRGDIQAQRVNVSGFGRVTEAN